MQYEISEINNILKGTLTKSVDYKIRYLLIDSRTLIAPEETLFFAITGKRNNGHNFIETLYNSRVRNFVVSELPKNINDFVDANFILVEDTSKALQELSIHHRLRFNIPVIGIAGSNGKTIIKEWIYDLLSQDRSVVRSPRSFNSQYGVPLSVWLLTENTEIAVFEAGISKLDEMSKLEKIIKPTIGIITNIGEAHQENFIDYRHKISEKLKLFQNCKTLIYCRDHQLIETQVQVDSQYTNCEYLTWSTKYPADLFVNKINKQENSTSISAKFNNKEININIPFVDDASVENSIHCWLLMLHLNYNADNISRLFNNLSQVAMRLELKEGRDNCTIINDSYNSDISSLNIALDFLNQQKQQKNKTVVLSDILQSGKDITALYSEVSDLLSQKKIDRLIGIGKDIKSQANLFKLKSCFFESTEEFLSTIPKFENDIILLKGARKFEFEKISNTLQQKVHETVLEINLNSVVDNLNYYKSQLNKDVQLMVMVKAFSYGSGMYEIANLLQYHHVDYLTVAFADEGVELRKAGISLPIMVMNPEKYSFDALIKYRLEPEIYSFSVLNEFYDAIRKNSLVMYPVHLKIDTGMKRLGFEEEEIDELIKNLETKPEFKIKTIFSHLVASDDAQHDTFTQNQFYKFDRITKKIKSIFDYKILIHILNSSGIERFKNAQYDMVRLGIGLYGFSPNNQNKLKNVSVLKTVISQIKTVKAGDSIGYNRKGIAEKDIKIAILPIGYADGLNRKLSNGKGELSVNGKLAKIIGNICMDMCMIDITNIEAKEGDRVIIFGNENPVYKMADALGTIPYEILTSISQRVKRVYFHE